MYIFILDLAHGFNGMGKGNCKMGQETIEFCGLVRLILGILLYVVIDYIENAERCVSFSPIPTGCGGQDVYKTICADIWLQIMIIFREKVRT